MKIGSLCTGYGGLDMALDGDTVWVSDIDKHAAKLLAHRFPTVPNLGDLTAVDWESVEPVNILTAGYPCQPFSHAGKREGQNDERHIWPHIANAIRVLRPGFVFLENVAGHLSLGFGDVLGDLAEAGYDAQWTSVRASDVGAPHRRERVFILASVRYPGHNAGGSELWQQPQDATGGASEPSEVAPTDSERDSRERWGNPRDVARTSRTSETDSEQRQRDGHTVSHSGPTTADSKRGRRDRRTQDTRRQQVKRATSTWHSDPTPTHTESDEQREPADGGQIWPELGDGAWGHYLPAVQRWGYVIGRPAPEPTTTGNTGRAVLNPQFVEWMMGLPAGWVTDVPGISRNGQLHLLGNGVVPQQAAHALAILADQAVAA